jgi:amidase
VTEPTSPILPIAPAFAPPADDLAQLSALEQARRIAAGELTSEALTEHYLTRIATHDPQLSAFIALHADRARAQARRVDKRRALGIPLAPFHGVPTAMKDHHMVRGMRTRIGSHAYSWLWSPVDDVLVKRMKAAGFVLLGKTSMSELGILPIVETGIAPPTRNPWNLQHTAGGSSGGAGAALGAGLLPVAPGSDGAGSVRIPSALNGLVGLKPSRGLVADPAKGFNRFGLVSVGPMGRTVEDAMALLDVLAGLPHGETARRAAEPIAPLKIGLLLDPPFGENDPRIVALIEGAAERLRAVGHKVERIPGLTVDLTEFVPLYQRVLSRAPVPFPSRLSPFARWFWGTGKKGNDADAWRRLKQFVDLAEGSQAGYDLLLTPTIGVLPPKVGEFAHLSPPEHFEALAPLGAYTALANLTGQPAISVPCGQVDGFPVGAQLVGRHGDDARLFGLARHLFAV